MVARHLVAASMISLLALNGCDVDVFGISEKKIAGGYRLYMGEGSFAIFAPNSSSGAGVIQVGWSKPIIIASTSDRDWEVFDTSTGTSRQFLTTEQIRSDATLRRIPLMPAQKAWDKLSHFQSQW
jgi:hypothetical protein